MDFPGYRLLLFVFLFSLLMPGSSAAQQGSRDDEYLINGLIRDGLYEVASDKIFDFVFKYPSHPRREKMLFDISETLIKQNSYAKAKPLLRCYLQEFPEGRWQRIVKLMLARALFTANDFSSASPLLDEIISDNNQRTADRLDAKEMLAEIYLSQGRNEDARVLLEEKSPKGTGPRIRLILAKNLIKLQQVAEAEELLKNLVSRRRRDDVWDEARETLVSLYLSLSRYQECLQLLNNWKAPTNNEYSAADKKISLALAVSYYHLGDYNLSYSYISPIFHASDNQADTAAQLPSVLFALKEWLSVVSILETNLNKEIDTLKKIEIGERLTEAYIETGNHEKAYATIKKIAPLYNDPDDRVESLLKAYNLVPTREEKIVLLKEAILMTPGEQLLSKIQYLLGRELTNLGQYEEAMKELEQSVLTDPTSRYAPESLLLISDLLSDSESLVEAEKVLLRIRDNFPNFSKTNNVLVKLIAIEYSLGKWGDVLLHYKGLKENSLPQEILPESIKFAAIAAFKTGDSSLAAELGLESYLYTLEDISWLQTFRIVQIDDLDIPEIQESELLAMMAQENPALKTSAALALINHYKKNSQWEKGNNITMQIEAQSPDSALRNWCRYQSAYFYEQMGQEVSRVNMLNNIVADREAGVYSRLAVKELQRIALSKGDYGSLLQSDPAFLVNSPVSIFAADQSLNKARTYFRSGNYSAAMAIYSAYPDKKNLFVEHQYYYAMSLYYKGDLFKAHGVFESIDNSTLLIAWQWDKELVSAQFYERTGAIEDAYNSYRALLQKPVPAEKRLAMLIPFAEIAEKLGKWPEARSVYLEFIQVAEADIPKSDLNNWEMVAEKFSKHQEYDQAIEILKMVRSLNVDQDLAVAVDFRIAELTAITRGDEAGIDAFLSIAYQNPDQGIWPARARLKAGQLYEKLGNAMAAERQFKLVAENWPESEEGKSAAKRLFELANIRTDVKEEQIQN